MTPAQRKTSKHNRIQYRRPPLEVVAFELRIPHALRLAERTRQLEVWDKLRDRLPITQPQPGIQVSVGGGQLMPQPLRMLDRSQTNSAVIGPEAIVLESTDYRSFEDFTALVEVALNALPANEIAGFTRVGLRYINEIRVPGAVAPKDWDGLIAAPLLASLSCVPDDLAVRRLSGEFEADAGDGFSVVVRYGTFATRIVSVEGPLQTRTDDATPAFVVDVDSFWESDPSDELPAFSTRAVLDTVTRLRVPSHTLFEVALTDALRDTFREEEK